VAKSHKLSKSVDMIRGHSRILIQLSAMLNLGLRGRANSHCQLSGGETFAKLDAFVRRRLYRWAKRRHPHKTWRWIAERYFPRLRRIVVLSPRRRAHRETTIRAWLTGRALGLPAIR
jgi:Group II intron, maturase-specific domain